jgi:leucyl aminopeptidase (aminopeptidase T)
VKRNSPIGFIVAAFLLLAFANVSSAQEGGMGVQEIAQRVVHESLKLGEEDYVLITTWAHTIPLAEALALEAMKAGAVPTIVLESDNLYRSVLSEVPEENLKKTPLHMLAALDAVTAEISLSGPEDPSVFEAGSPASVSAMNEAYHPLMEKSRTKKIRGAYIQYGFATPERAKRYGVDHTTWSQGLSGALTSDLKKISRDCKIMASIFENAKKIEVTHSNGTKLKMSLAGRAASAQDGIVDASDIAKGHLWATLPAGNVTCAPNETSVNGKVVVEKMALWGQVVKNLTWNFKDGKLVSYKAGENEKVFAEFLNGATGDKDRFASISIGLNPHAKSTGANLTDWIVRGAISLGIGNNEDLGGENKTDFGWSVTLLGATVKVDGKTIVDKGKLKI